MLPGNTTGQRAVATLFGETDQIPAGYLEGTPAIVLLGPPGSGKGTQAALLGARLNVPHISTGDMLRDRILRGDSLGRQIAERIDFGQFVPDAWINQILDERLGYTDCGKGFILDGYPRTPEQAMRFLENAVKRTWQVFVVKLQAEASELARRFAGRRQCCQCGTLFHVQFQPSLAGDRCDRPQCEGLLIPRADDREEFLARRLEDYETYTKPVLDLLGPQSRRVFTIDANAGSPTEIHERVWARFREKPSTAA